MKKIALIAPTGMLGSMIYTVFSSSYDLTLVYRDTKSLSLLDKKYGNVKKHKKVHFDINSILEDFKKGFYTHSESPSLGKLRKEIGQVDAVINCAGIIKPHALVNTELTFFINGAFPHLLSEIYKERLIHITTDCVYSGLEGAPYNESSQKSPNDLYGISKLLGEPQEKSFVLRTSIIGPELHGFLSLLDWFKNQKGEINGFSNHLWNGITTKQFALICQKIIEERKDFPSHGLFHIFSTDVTKYDMLATFKKIYKAPVTIKSVKADVAVDRRLSSLFDVCEKLEIPSFEKMMEQL